MTVDVALVDVPQLSALMLGAPIAVGWQASQRVVFAGVGPSAALARGAGRERASRMRKLSPEVTTTVA